MKYRSRFPGSIVLCVFLIVVAFPAHGTVSGEVGLGAGAIETGPEADLSGSAAPSTVKAQTETEITVTFTLRNTGDKEGSATAVAVTKLPDGWTITSEDNDWQDTQNTWLSLDPVPAGGQYEVSGTVTVPAEVTAGDYSIQVEGSVTPEITDTTSVSISIEETSEKTTATATSSGTETATATRTASPNLTPTATAEPTQTVTPTAEPTQTVTPTAEPTQTVTPTAEPTPIQTATLTSTAATSDQATPLPTATSSGNGTARRSPASTATATTTVGRPTTVQAGVARTEVPVQAVTDTATATRTETPESGSSGLVLVGGAGLLLAGILVGVVYRRRQSTTSDKLRY